MVQYLACSTLMCTCTFWFILNMTGCRIGNVGASSADNDAACTWEVFYSMEPVRHKHGFQLYFKTSRESCESKSVSLELFRAKWSNLTICQNKDHLMGIYFNITADHTLWYTNLQPGNYCVLIKPLARDCSKCHPSFTELVTLLSSQDEEVNQTLTKRESALSDPNAAGLYIAVSGVLLMSAVAFLLFIRNRSARMSSQQDENPIASRDIHGSCECTCESKEPPLLASEVFILHARDAWHRSNALCQKLRDVLPLSSSTLVTTLNEKLFTLPSEWIAQTISPIKVIFVESEGAVNIFRKQMKKAGIHTREVNPSADRDPETFPCLGSEPDETLQDDDLDYMDLTFLNGLASIMRDKKRYLDGYNRVFVVRFPSTPKEVSVGRLVENVRFTLPKHFPDLCLRLVEIPCVKCRQMRYREWKRIAAEDGQFRMQMTQEMPTPA